MITFFTMAYNAENTILRAMDSILNQTERSLRYYVLDNGSTDRTRALIMEYAAIDDRVIPLTRDINHTLETNVIVPVWAFIDSLLNDNVGSGDYFAILDADDEYEPYFLEKMLSFTIENDLDVACCGTQGISVQTGEIINTDYWKLHNNLILEGESFSYLFPKYYPFTWSYWAKLFSIDVLRQCDISCLHKYYYAADGAFTREVIKNSKRVGICSTSAHKYYISSKSSMNRYDALFIDSNCQIHDNMIDYLTAINGATPENIGIVYVNYATSIRSISATIFNATTLNIGEKLAEFRHLFSIQYTIDMVVNPYVPKEQYIGLFASIANWILSQNIETKDLGVAVWLLLWLNNVTSAQAYVSKIKKMLAKSPITTNIGIGEAYYLRDPISAIINGDLEKAFDEIGILAEDEIPDKFAEAYLRLAQNISALMEYSDGYIFYVKQWIEFLIEHSRYNEAATELNEMQDILPEDEYFADCQNKIFELLSSDIAIADDNVNTYANGKLRKFLSCIKLEDIGTITTSVIIFGKQNMSEMLSYIKSICSCAVGTSLEILVINIWNLNLERLQNRFEVPLKILSVSGNKNISHLYNSAIEICEDGTDICFLDDFPSINWLDSLKMALYSDDTIGVAFSCITQSQYSITSNSNAWKMRTRIALGCVLIKHEALMRVGVFDESFETAEYSIDDISVSMQLAGFKLLQCEDSQVSIPKKRINEVSLARDLLTFKDKWDFNPRYSNFIRSEIIIHIDKEKDAPIKVLEVGCGCGATLVEVKNRYKNAKLFAVEFAQTPAKIASRYAETRATDIEHTNLDFSVEHFDYIIFADVLEHLVDPWKVVRMFKDYLTPSGAMLCSIPNVMHWEVVSNLLNGNWDYSDAGILDRTHLRFFTLKSIHDMFNAAGFKNTYVSSVSMGGNDMADKLAEITRKDMKQQYLTYQYIVKAVSDRKEENYQVKSQ